MFSVRERERLRERVLELARADSRLVAGAVVGSLADSDGDRFSDLDLTFGVALDVPVHDVLEEWTGRLQAEFDAVHLFDLPGGATIYRVFLLPGCLQFDLSFAPASAFGAVGPQFKLLFGQAVEKPYVGPPSVEQLFGYAVHHAVRARVCIERGRYCQAEYWVSGVRDYALSLACRRRDLPAYHGRGFDDLPVDLQGGLQAALVSALNRAELLRALRHAIEGLLGESLGIVQSAAALEAQLREVAISKACSQSVGNGTSSMGWPVRHAT